MSILLKMDHAWLIPHAIEVEPRHMDLARSIIAVIESVHKDKCAEVFSVFELRSSVQELHLTYLCKYESQSEKDWIRRKVDWLIASAKSDEDAQKKLKEMEAQAGGKEAAADSDNVISEKKQQDAFAFIWDEISSLALIDELNADNNCDDKAMNKRLIKSLRRKDAGLVKLEPVWAKDSHLDLQMKFPNFKQVITILNDYCDLSRLGDGAMRMTPILLLGDPGVGKSRFVSEVAKLINTPYRYINMSMAQTGSFLGGSDRHWSNSKPGLVFEELVLNGQSANPIFMLDEIDKASGHVGYDPCAALYSLLEKSQAKEFKDQKYPNFVFDASHILWFAAANRESDIDQAILSRFQVLKVPAPTRDEQRHIYRNMYAELRAEHEWGERMDADISEAVIDRIEGLGNRQAKRAILSFCANSVRDGRNYLAPKDVNLDAFESRAKVGFVR